MSAMLDYSSHKHGGFMLEVDRNGPMLQVSLTSPHGDTVCAEFPESEAEEIAASFARVYRSLRLRGPDSDQVEGRTS